MVVLSLNRDRDSSIGRKKQANGADDRQADGV
jgi:hypothetical protein